jgi:hypothetical protein
MPGSFMIKLVNRDQTGLTLSRDRIHQLYVSPSLLPPGPWGPGPTLPRVSHFA